MAVANHALLYHRYGAFIHAAGSPRASHFNRTALSQTTGLWALPHLSHTKRNLPAKCNHSFAAIARLGEREITLEDDIQASFRDTEPSNKGWLTLAMAGWLGSFHPIDYARAVEDSEAIVTKAATKTAPEWVTPVVLAVPVASYLLFAFYRNKVNPYAKLTDWVFGLAAMAILGNLVLIATVGVRLY